MPRIAILTLAATALALGGPACTMVRYYKVSEVRKTFAKSRKQVDKIIRKAGKDLKKRKAGLKKLASRGADLDGPTGRELKGMMKQMKRLRAELGEVVPRIEKLRKRLDRVVGKKKKITQKDSRYPKVQGLIDEMKALHDQARKLVKKYQKLASKFKKRAKKLQ